MDLTCQGKSKRLKLLSSLQEPPDVYQETEDQILHDSPSNAMTEAQPQIPDQENLQNLDDSHYSKNQWNGPFFDFENDSDSSSSDDSWYNKLDECESLKNKLREWNISFSIKANALTALLGILRSHDCFSNLPSDSRTLLKTPSCVSVVPVDPGFYSHIGLESNLQQLLESVKEDVSHVKLLINIDGLPLF